MRERWFGATGRRVPELVVEGDPLVPLDEALVLDDVADDDALHRAHEEGTPVVVHADSVDKIVAALRRPEVASVILPADKPELLDLDLRELTYG
ncbi:MAG TPA: hypothetical protein VF063_10225 [Gaiellaceae bacterium]